MKKILFVALLATLLAASCQKTEIINPVGNKIGFSTGMNKLTKAADADSSGTFNLQEQNFRVWAYGAYEDPNTEKNEMNHVYDGIENLAVTYAGGWGTVKEYYWPGVGKDLMFFAVSADQTFLGTSGTTSTNVSVTHGATIADATMTVQKFTVNSDSPNEDLMVADFVQQNQNDKVVDLHFHHALSKVEFVFKTLKSNDTTKVAPQVFVQSLVVDSLATKGTLNVCKDTSAASVPVDTTGNYAATVVPVEFKWEVDSTDVSKKSFKDDWNGSVTYIEGTDTTAVIDTTAMQLTVEPQTFSTWLMLPQNIEGKKVAITYVINKRQFTSIFALDKNDLKEWTDNQHIKYTVTLAPNVISFNPIVNDWANPTDREYQN